MVWNCLANSNFKETNFRANGRTNVIKNFGCCNEKEKNTHWKRSGYFKGAVSRQSIAMEL